MKKEEHAISILVRNQPGVLSRVSGVFSSRGYNIKSLCVAETIDPNISRITLTSQAERTFTEKIKKQLDKLIDVVEVSDFTGPDYIHREMMMIGIQLKPESRSEILRAIEMFHCKIITMTTDYYVLEITGTKEENTAVLSHFQLYDVEEINRTGPISVRRNKV
ncbi:MAG: acetolactate synthase small subunit [Deltaproteobacteria bacterium]|nr:acetolactate synthase small subunit [Deltaproteobacteria bacterium]